MSQVLSPFERRYLSNANDYAASAEMLITAEELESRRWESEDHDGDPPLELLLPRRKRRVARPRSRFGTFVRRLLLILAGVGYFGWLFSHL